MYPTLSHLIKDLLGVYIPLPFATFGFFVALSFIISAFFLKLELKRKEKEGLVHSFFDKKGNSIHPFETVSTMILVAGLFGIIGARIFSILEYPDEFLNAPIDTLISFSGLTFYGGLIFGSIAAIIYARKKGISTIHLLDASAPALMLAYAIGRIGCQLSGDGDWGIDNLSPKPLWLKSFPDWTWAYHYPHNVINQGIHIEGCTDKYCNILANPVFPTPLYEITICFFLFLVLWFLRKRIRISGLLFSLYLIFNAIERFYIEKIRIDSEYVIFNLHFKQATFIAIILFIAGIFLAGYSLRQKQYSDTNEKK